MGVYLCILEDLVPVRLHQPWHSNLSNREVRTPKAYVTDTGMMTALIGSNADRISSDPAVSGPAFETFVTMELVKLSSWAEASPRPFHDRDRDGREVDVVLERADGSIMGVEVKSAATAVSGDFRALAYLRDKLGRRFVRGVVVYTGARSLPFGDRLSAVPISSLGPDQHADRARARYRRVNATSRKLARGANSTITRPSANVFTGPSPPEFQRPAGCPR